MAEDKKPNLFQKIANLVKELIDWLEETFSDPALSAQILADLGLDSSAPPTPKKVDPATTAKIQEFVAKQDVDKAALAATIAEVKALVDTGLTFADAVKTDGVTGIDVLWLMFKTFAIDSLQARNPAGYGLVSLVGLATEDEEALNQLDLGPLVRLFEGKVPADSTDVIDRLSFLAGTTVVGLDSAVTTVGGRIDAAYGWDPEPGDSPDTVSIAARSLSIKFIIPDLPAQPVLTLIGVPAEHGGPGVVVSLGAALQLVYEGKKTVYTFDGGARGAFTVYVGAGSPRALGGFSPSLSLRAEPKPNDGGLPAFVLGTSNGTRLEVGSVVWGLEIGPDHAGFRIGARKGKLVVSLGEGDGFLQNLPGGNIEVPFDLGLIMDTKGGVRFEGGSGLKVNLPVAATLYGVFTVQYFQLEVVLSDRVRLELRGGFGVKLGPFQASVDQLGLGADITSFKDGADFGETVRFLPPKGIGLRLDAGAVKGGGYLFIDAQRGEYAGALELTIVGVFSVKAICLISTRRADGSEGYSLLLMIYGQFSVHIAFGIFLTGIGGLIGLHHRVDLEALTAGMKSGVLDDVLFPNNPVADAPRIINRYKQLFPVEPDSLLIGPMLELSFSEPPIVYVRLGLIFEVRNALAGDKPLAVSKVVLVGQLLAQLPPKATGAPAILKLLIDVVGFYDVEEKFLMIRARLRDSFVGIEGFATLNLSGELLLAMHFGDDPSFVLSAGGFHPAFKEFPPGVPHELERLAVSFGIGPIHLRCENYFAITSNSVQAGFKISLKADFDVAAIEGWLAFDAMLYLAPRFRFMVGVDFKVSVEAFGESLCSVTVKMQLEGPGEWRAKGEFGFSILFWDVSVPFDEKWGSAPAVDSGSISASALMLQELRDPQRLLPEAPVGGDALVTLAAVEGITLPLAHPLGRLTVRQRVVPFEVPIDRIGTKKLTEGTVAFAVAAVLVGDVPTAAREPVLDHFARGQYMDLSEDERLGGHSFERFPCGVSVGTSAYAVAGTSRTVAATYEEKILEPESTISRFPWTLYALATPVLTLDSRLLQVHVALGAASQSPRAHEASLAAGGPVGGATVLHDAPLMLVHPKTLEHVASLLPSVAGSTAVAEFRAAAAGAVVVEAFELGGL
ncbi:DUF6603 domain-containing protein [Arthrobacter sp. OAP107]|uniref:DUF6603 domain-containing protein n=1 Tax=Arthrobacter sp. OAP107 TaxID=3156445 RepID=UPI00339A2A04